MVAIKANGEVIAANTEKIGIFNSVAETLPATHNRLGITPFEISVVAESQHMYAPVIYFPIVALITTTICVAVIFMYRGCSSLRPAVSAIKL